MMTFHKFIQAFKKVASPSSWRVTTGLIRHRSSKHCPLSWVAYQVDKNVDPCAVATSQKVLGINARAANRIIKAADNVGKRPITRKALLTVIGR